MKNNQRIRQFCKVIGFFCFGLFIQGCTENTPKGQPALTKAEEAPKKTHVTVPDFNPDSAFSFVKVQSDMGPRTPGSKAHEKCADYFVKKFTSYGAEVTVQKVTVTTFDNKKWPAKNIIASFNKENPNRILLCAHWDSRPFCDRDTVKTNERKPCPGVNDGASGAGVLLEIARLLASQKTSMGIDIMLWDLEDYGIGETGLADPGTEDDWALGSQYWSKNPHKAGYTAKYGILLDMVGAGNSVFPLENTSAYYAGPVQQKIWSAASSIGYGTYFVNRPSGEITDDHLYINKWASIPCVDIIGYDSTGHSFFAQHHTADDVIDHIDKKTMKAVGQTVLEVICNETP